MKISRLIRLGLPTGRRFALGLALAALQGLSAVALLASSAWLISRSSEQPNQVYVAIAVVGVRTFAVGRAAFRYAERMVLHDTAFRMLTNIRPRILRKLIPIAPIGMVGVGRGQTLQSQVQDVDELQNLSLRVIAPLTQAVLVSIAASAFLAVFAPLAGIALQLATIAALLIAVPLAAKLVRNAEGETVAVKAQISELALQLIETAELLRAYGWHSDYLKRLTVFENQLIGLQRRSAAGAGLTNAAFAALGIIATCTTAWFGAIEVSNGNQLGVMLAVFALVPMAVFDVLTGTQGVAGAWQKYRESAMRVQQILDSKMPSELVPDLEQANGVPAADSDADVARIEFESLKLTNLEARYPGSDSLAVSGVNLELIPGSRTLITGESGAGKSTIANVLLRFLKPSAGVFEINGQPAEHYSVRQIRRLIGLIEQQPVVFSGTVRQNLRLANDSADDGELADVLRRVGLWAVIEARGGLDLWVGERGMLLSGGEAARLALARALLSDCSVIIFDEPTANLDRHTATSLMQQLMAAAADANRAVLLISHDRELASLTTSEVVVQKPRHA